MMLSVLNYSELLFELVMKTSKLTELGYFRHILTTSLKDRIVCSSLRGSGGELSNLKS